MGRCHSFALRWGRTCTDRARETSVGTSVTVVHNDGESSLLVRPRRVVLDRRTQETFSRGPAPGAAQAPFRRFESEQFRRFRPQWWLNDSKATHG